MSEKRETSISGTAWLFLLILVISSCRTEVHTRRIMEAVERISPRPVQP